MPVGISPGRPAARGHDFGGDPAAQAIPTRDATVLVYCRSGNRSQTASAALAQLGYTQVYEFGGIQDWPYEVGAGSPTY